jgi:hypothetical protein
MAFTVHELRLDGETGSMGSCAEVDDRGVCAATSGRFGWDLFSLFGPT